MINENEHRIERKKKKIEKDANGASSRTLQGRSVGSGKTDASVFKNGRESP